MEIGLTFGSLSLSLDADEDDQNGANVPSNAKCCFELLLQSCKKWSCDDTVF